MKITKEMLELGMLPEWLQEFLEEQYMEYPEKDSKRRFIMQHHWRGKSVHTDFRMEIDDHLIGWTCLEAHPKEVTEDVDSKKKADEMLKKVDWKFQWKHQAEGFRAETKARQPKSWLEMKGYIPPGKVGATKTKPGFFNVIGKGKYWEGTQKPYFHEYFFKDTLGILFPTDRFVRIVFRGVKVPRLDPETKKPIKGEYEIMWRGMIPEDQTAYVLKRGIKKRWKPPKGIIPIPSDQRKGELWEKWKEFMKEKTNLASSNAKFTLHQVSWMGPVHVRGIPNIEFYLRIDDKGEGSIRSWLLTGSPLRGLPQGAVYEGRINRKWLSFSGDIPPGKKYNPTKELTARMEILDTGKVTLAFPEAEVEILELDFKGKKLKGKLRLIQEEKGADTYSLERLFLPIGLKYSTEENNDE